MTGPHGPDGSFNKCSKTKFDKNNRQVLSCPENIGGKKYGR